MHLVWASKVEDMDLAAPPVYFAGRGLLHFRLDSSEEPPPVFCADVLPVSSRSTVAADTLTHATPPGLSEKRPLWLRVKEPSRKRLDLSWVARISHQQVDK